MCRVGKRNEKTENRKGNQQFNLLPRVSKNLLKTTFKFEMLFKSQKVFREIIIIDNYILVKYTYSLSGRHLDERINHICALTM